MKNKSPIEESPQYSELNARFSRFLLDFRKEKLAQQLAGNDKNRDEITRGDFQSFKARMTEGLELTDYDLDRIHRRVLSVLLRPEAGSVLQDE
ncbi:MULTISPECIES: hypothetical protein [unclassified Ruegeria]|uniref:hypothetical protein n=1 Tax=unclassified Ruegeria TaxID=2625375 RepID=UPI001AE3F179|nr:MULTISPECIES: hypothetical protein [unclassified Ruegeria]